MEILQVPKDSVVSVHYTVEIENSLDPADSTVHRKEPLKVDMQEGDASYCFDLLFFCTVRAMCIWKWTFLEEKFNFSLQGVQLMQEGMTGFSIQYFFPFLLQGVPIFLSICGLIDII